MTTPQGPPALADTGALGIRLGRSLKAGSETQRAEAILEDVSALARSEGKNWPADNIPPDVRAVVLAAALRVFKNPNMYTSSSAGPFTNRIHDSAFATGTFTSAELAILVRSRGKSGLWTQATTRGEDDMDTGYLPVEGSSESFPYFHGSDPFNGYGDHYGQPR